MLSPNFFNTVFVFPILNLLVALYKGFLLLKVPGAFGLAIIGLTVLVRLLFYPFFKQQIETSKKMQDIKPHLDKLSAKHKKDPQKLQQEQLKLYKEAGINPAMGCLVALVNIPIFYALYNTLYAFLHNGTGEKVIADINKVLYSPLLKIQSIDPHFFGYNLALSPQKAGVWYYYLIPLITAYLQYLSVPAMSPAPAPAPAKKEETKDEKKQDTGGDFQQAMSMQMKYFFPLMIGWFAFTLPVGLALYWNIVSLFTIIQYRAINKNTKS